MGRARAVPRWRHLWRWLQVLRPGIWLATGSQAETKTREQLLDLLARYDLSRWQFTDRIRIAEGAIPHSHPVLTLGIRHLDNDAPLLATYLHEQLHWFVARNKGRERSAIEELKRLYLTVPVGAPEGARDEHSSYLHHIVCYLEYVAIIDVLGPEEARRVIDFWCDDHYMEIYQTVVRDFHAIEEIVSRHGLVP